VIASFAEVEERAADVMAELGAIRTTDRTHDD